MPAALPPKTPLGQLIRDARESMIVDLSADGGKGEKHVMSQVELAKLVNVRQQTLSRWEAGIIMPPIDRLPALAAALHLDVNDIFAASVASAGQTEAPAITERRRLDKVESDVERILSVLEVISTRLGIEEPMADQSPAQPVPIRSAARPRRQAPVQAARRQKAR